MGEDECSVNRGIIRGCGASLLSKLYLTFLTEGAVMTQAGSSSQYFTTLTKKADPAVALTLEYLVEVAVLDGRKNQFGFTSNRSVNILNVVIRSARSRRHCKE